MTRDQLQEQLTNIRQQETALYEQWCAAQGARQMLEHLLSIEDQTGVGEPAPSAAQHNAALVESMNGRPIEEADHASATD